MSAPTRPSFELIDHHGRAVSESSFTGQWLLVLFGFTNCRVVCPRALDRVSGVLDDLGELAERLQPLYVTVDPARNTAPVMAAFLQPRSPRFLGLSGTEAQIDHAKEAFRVFAARRPDPKDPDGYAVPHTAITYLVDPAGTLVRHWGDTVAAATVLAELRAELDAA